MSGNAEGQRRLVGTDKRVRADAQRSLDALLVSAKTVFATSGVDAPVREIAERAGVGLGTLYRHFPQRADLIAAVFRREIDACADAAPVLAREQPPFAALAAWLQRYALFIGAKRGLAKALHSGDPAFDALPGHFDARPRGASATPAAAARISMPTSFWAQSRASACRRTMPTRAAPPGWSRCSSTGCVSGRARGGAPEASITMILMRGFIGEAAAAGSR